MLNHHPLIDNDYAIGHLAELRSNGDAARRARLAAAPRRLAAAGPRAGLARWVSRSVLRAEPCPELAKRQHA